jgi:4-amino-4-deoxy-L-arabinose transferase-like glycosyltransferase
VPDPQPISTARRHRAALLVAAVVLLGTGLGATDLWAPDEPRYGQVAEEIRALEDGAGSLVLLRLGGEPYTQKPPLYYWLAAAAGQLTGNRVSEVAARLPSMLAGIAAVLVTHAFALSLFRSPWGSPRGALFAGVVLLTSFRFAHLARRAQLDVLLTLLETVALLAFWRIDEGARDPQARRPGRGLVLLLHVALGAAALTKGPVGWIPGLVIVVYLAWERRLALLRTLIPPWGLLFSVAPLVLWISAATWLAPAGFFSEAVVANLFDRFFSAGSHVRPIYYFVYQLPADFLPWSLLLPLAAWVAWRQLRAGGDEARPWRLLVVWVAIPLVVFSVASGKRGLYLLPAFPALAMMTAAALESRLRARGELPRWMGPSLFGVGTLFVATAAVVAARGGFGSQAHPGFELSPGAALSLGLGAALGLVAGVVAARRSDSLERAVAIVAATALAVFVVEWTAFAVVFPEYDAEKSPRPIAVRAAALAEPAEAVGIFDDEGLAGGILYYGHRPVQVLRRPNDVARFLGGGGRFVVLERWKLPWLDPVGRFRVHASERRGRRELAIVALEATQVPAP